MRAKLSLAVLVVFGLLAPVLAQQQNGSIYGTVVDQSGAVLPGTTVTLTSEVIATKVATTGSQGEFRFLNLPPGSYKLEMSLAGFEPRKRAAVVGVGAKVEVREVLGLAGTAAELEVTGTAPVLETKKSGAATNVPLEELQSIPSARDPWVVLSSVPSVLVDRVNVGGSESGQQSVFAGKGDNGDNTVWNIDGVTITDMGAIGSSPTYYDFDSFEEFQVTTGGSDPKMATGGIGINMVTKRGGNEFHGSARVFFTNDSLQGDNIPDNIAAINQTALDGGAAQPPFPGNRIDKTTEWGGEVGGPLIKDRLWFWGSYAKNNITQLAATGAPDKTTLKDYSGKLNAQLTDSNQANFFYFRGDKIKIGRNAGVTRPAETSWDQTGPTDIYKFEDFHNFGPDFYLSGKYAHVGGGFQLTPQGGREISATRDSENVWHRSYLHYETVRPQDQVAVDGNYFANWGSTTHEFKFGFNYRKTPIESLSSWPGDRAVSDGAYADVFGEGTAGIVWVTRDAIRSSTQDAVGAYFGDTITADRLTFNVGARYDRQKGNNLGGTVPASPFAPDLLPAIEVQDSPNRFTFKDLSPRFGLTYALGQDRKTLFRASYANYADQLSSSGVTFDNPFNGPAELDYLWVSDTNGDGVAQPDEVDFDALLGSYYVDPDNPSNTTSVDIIDGNLSAPRTHEAIVGLEREVVSNFAIGGNLTWRKRYNDTWSPYRKADGSIVTGQDYRVDRMITADNITDPEAREWYQSQFGQDFSVPFYVLNDGIELAPGNGRLLTNRDGYSTRYMGFELFATKRLSNRWSMRGSMAWNRWTEHYDGLGAMGDPTSTPNSPNVDGGIAYTVVGSRSGAKADVFLNSAWQFNVNALYQMPWGFNVAANVFGRQGYPAPLYVTIADPDGLSSTKSVLLAQPEDYRMPNVMSVDFRLEKSFSFMSRHNLVFDMDIFNLFNTNSELQLNRRANTNLSSTDAASEATLRAFLRPREIVAPRLIRFGVRYSF